MSDLPENLVALQRSSWEAQRRLAAYPKPSQWTDVHAASWPEDWAAFREAALAFQLALPVGADRYRLEMAVKAAVRHPAPEAA